MDVSEAPVGVRGDDGGDELSDTEGTEQRERRALHEEETVRTGDEDQGLRDDGDLEVDDHVQLRVVVVDRAGRVLEADTELVLEERSLDDDNNKDDPRKQNISG